MYPKMILTQYNPKTTHPPRNCAPSCQAPLGQCSWECHTVSCNITHNYTSTLLWEALTMCWYKDFNIKKERERERERESKKSSNRQTGKKENNLTNNRSITLLNLYDNIIPQRFSIVHCQLQNEISEPYFRKWELLLSKQQTFHHFINKLCIIS